MGHDFKGRGCVVDEDERKIGRRVERSAADWQKREGSMKQARSFALPSLIRVGGYRGYFEELTASSLRQDRAAGSLSLTRTNGAQANKTTPTNAISVRIRPAEESPCPCKNAAAKPQR